MISELYVNQEAVVRIAGGDSDSGIIGRGVRQGCPLSPLLFSIYAEMMMKEALENVDSLNITAKHFDMKINIKKRKAMVVSRDGGERVNITVEGQSVEKVSKFRY